MGKVRLNIKIDTNNVNIDILKEFPLQVQIQEDQKLQDLQLDLQNLKLLNKSTSMQYNK